MRTALVGESSASVQGGLRDAIEARVQAELARVVADRRAIHAHPELGERETVTAGRVAERLRALGFDEVREGIGPTGVVGVLRGGRPGPVVAYRADMDALPITEDTGLPFASTRTDEWGGKQVGVMHACGHDFHVAIGLGVAAVLADPEIRAELPGTVLFVFQPAEEGIPESRAYGAERMLAEGAFDDPTPEAVFGLHVNPLLEVGTISAIPGGAMAAADRFRIDVTGRGVHGAYPQDGVDTILAASQIVVGLQSVVARNVDTRDTAVVTVGKIAAGNRFNIIPDTAELVGTIRTHDPLVQALVHERVRALAEGIASAHGASVEVGIETLAPMTINDPALRARMAPSLERSVGAGNLVDEKPHMGAEDFSHLANHSQGLFYFLGVSDRARGIGAMIHTPQFAPDERALAIGVRTSANLLADYLRGQ